VRPVVVVGNGLAAFATTLGLAQVGIEVTLVRTGPTPEIESCMLPWHVLPSLDALGVLDELVAAGHPSRERQLRVLATGECLTADLAAAPDVIGHPFDLGCSDDLVLSTLFARITAHGAVHVLDGEVRRLSQGSDSVALTVLGPDGREELIAAQWVVAADGLGSPIRRLLGIGFPGTTWQERCVEVTLAPSYDFEAYAGATLQVDPRYGAVLRRSQAGWRYLYAENLGHSAATVGDRVVPTIAAVHPDAAAAVQSWRSGRMHERTATAFRAGRVLLAGNAAHATNPISGLAVVASLRDATVLAGRLSAALRSRGHDAELDTYAEMRRREFLDRTMPASVERKNLATQISDPDRLSTELEQYRRALTSPSALRELLGSESLVGSAEPVF
jgi:2-polyprenyl-6-methoxyphenol hydroxylase-like FAD-dependent oxidoreductase